MAGDDRTALPRPIPKSLAVCARCEENLYASSKESILLSCLHSYCKVCVRAGCLPRLGDGNMVECPKCKSKCQRQDIGCCLFFLPANEPEKEQKCVACDENLNATSFCVQCDENICDTCVQAHRRVRLTKDHEIRPLGTGVAMDTRSIYCQKHTNEKLRYFCEPCDKLTCRLCRNELHKDHRCRGINDAAEALRRELKTQSKLIDGKVGTLRGALSLLCQRVKAVNESENRVRAQIGEFMVRCYENLASLEKSLYADLDFVAKSKRQSLQHKQDDIENLLKIIYGCKETLDFTTGDPSDTALLCMRRPLSVHAQDLVNARCQVPNPTHVLDICFKYEPKTFAQMKHMGMILINNQQVERALEQRHATGPTLSASIVDAVSSGSSSVDSSVPANAGADAASAVTRSRPSRSQGVQETNQALMPKPNGQEKTSSATDKTGYVPSPVASASVSRQSGATAVSEAVTPNASPLAVARRSDQRVTEANAVRSANTSASSAALKDLKGLAASQRAKDDSRKERSCAIAEATANVRVEGPDVCAADSSHSPRRQGQSAKQSDVMSLSAKQPEHRQLVRETEADSAAGQDSGVSDFDMIRITNIKSLAPTAAETADTTTTNSSMTTAPRRGRWSPYNVANNHKPDDFNEDYCAVCHNGGELMCCDTCPKVYHVQCHVPELSLPFSAEKWSCSLCVPEARTGVAVASSVAAAAATAVAQSEEPVTGKRKAPLGLTDVELKLCEHILLKLFCYKGSQAFHFPVQKTVPNYYRMIKEPMDFTSIKKKLLRQHFNHYMTFSEFIADINLIFANCQTYNPPGSELAEAAIDLHAFFVDLVRMLMPHLVDEATKLRKPEDVMHKSALKKKKSGDSDAPPPPPPPPPVNL